MGRFFRLSQILAGALWLFPASAQEPAPAANPAEAPVPPDPASPDKPHPPGPPPEFGNRRDRPPGERERFGKQLKKWEELSDEEKDKLRERGKQLFERGRQEVEKAIAELDVELSPEKRQEFIKAYFQKRREIERQIWEETEPRRKELIQKAVGELKTEFGGKPTAAPSPAPAATH